jgi:hypothetical protein
MKVICDDLITVIANYIDVNTYCITTQTNLNLYNIIKKHNLLDYNKSFFNNEKITKEGLMYLIKYKGVQMDEHKNNDLLRSTKKSNLIHYLLDNYSYELYGEHDYSLRFNNILELEDVDIFIKLIKEKNVPFRLMVNRNTITNSKNTSVYYELIKKYPYESIFPGYYSIGTNVLKVLSYLNNGYCSDPSRTNTNTFNKISELIKFIIELKFKEFNKDISHYIIKHKINKFYNGYNEYILVNKMDHLYVLEDCISYNNTDMAIILMDKFNVNIHYCCKYIENHYDVVMKIFTIKNELNCIMQLTLYKLLNKKIDKINKKINKLSDNVDEISSEYC